MAEPNFPIPAEFHGKRLLNPLRRRKPTVLEHMTRLILNDLRTVIRRGDLEGKISWNSTRVQTEDLFWKLSRMTAIFLLESICNPSVLFNAPPYCQLDEKKRKNLEARVDEILKGEPVDDPELEKEAEEIRKELYDDTILVSPEMFRKNSREIDREWVNHGLPPLPPLNHHTSRANSFLEITHRLLVKPKGRYFSSPILKYVEIVLYQASRNEAQGIRIVPTEADTQIEFLFADRKESISPMPKLMTECVVVTLAGAIGIHPNTLPPASSQIEICVLKQHWIVDGKTSMTDFGEQIEIHWRKK